MTLVIAVVRTDPSHPELAEATRAALTRQTRAADAVLDAPARDSLAEGAAAGLQLGFDRDADWVWLLDGVTVPEPGALEALLAATDLEPVLPAPLLVAGNVLDEAGAPHPDALPRHELFEKELSVAAVERRLVHLRSARHGSLLVSRAAVERFGLPDARFTGGDDALEWTTRMLRSWSDPGYLATGSVAMRRVAPVPVRRREDFANRLRMLRGPTWSPTERLWYGYLLAIDAVGAMAGRAPAPRA